MNFDRVKLWTRHSGWITPVILMLSLLPISLSAQLEDSLASFFPLQRNDSAVTSQIYLDDLYGRIIQQVGEGILVEQSCPVQNLVDDLSSSSFQISTWIQKSIELRRQGQIDCSEALLIRLGEFASTESPAAQTLVESHLALTAAEYKGDYNQAKGHALLAIDLATGAGAQRAWAYYAAGRVHHRLADYTLAYEQTEKALTLARKEKNLAVEARALGSLALINRDVFFGETLKAVPLHKSAIAIAREIADTAVLMNELLYIAANYGEAAKDALYFENLEEVIKLADSFKEIRIEEKILISFGAYLSANGHFEKAEQLFLKALDLALLLDQKASINHLYYQLFEVYLLSKQTNKAYKILYDGMQSGILEGENIKEQLYAIERVRGNNRAALEHLEEAYNGIKEKYMDRNSVMLSFWETQLKTKESQLAFEQQQELVEAVKSQRRLLFFLLLMITLFLLLAIYGMYAQRQSKRKLSVQKKQIEQQAAELQQLDVLKSRFFTNISHELRTPLSLILGPIKSILSRGALDERNGKLLSMAAKNGEQLNELVNEILDFSKLESQKMVLQESAVNLYLFLQHLISRFDYLKTEDTIQFILDYQADKSENLLIDKNKLEKIVNNLLSNAFKFTPPKGTIKLEVAEQEGYIQLALSDTGKGIHKEDLPHVFDRYFQANDENNVNGGTGIGLALSYQYVELLGGTIWADSTLGKGSTFFVKLPKKLVKHTADAIWDTEVSTGPSPAEHYMSPPSGTRKGILVVEDNTDLRFYLSQILSPHFQVKAVRNGEEALNYLHAPTQGYPVLIISDWMMPMMNGFDLLGKMRETPKFSSLPFIMLTARADLKDKLKALRIGVDDYLVKPFVEEELLARVDNLLRRHLTRESPKRSKKNTEEESLIGEGNAVRSKQDLAWLITLENVIEKHLGDFNLTADIIAGELLMSRTQLFRKVKKLTGLTVNQYLQEMRFQKARHLLETKAQQSVKSVAFTVGFKHVKNFSQRFKERFGRLPSSYL